MVSVPACLPAWAYGALARHGKRCAAAAVLATGVTLGMALPAAAEPLRLVALGDSLTQGFGLPEEDGLVPQLQAWLDAEGHDVKVINAGVSGDTTAGGRARLDWTLAEPADAMLVALGGNDLLRGIDPAESRANLDAILARLGEEGIPAMLVGLPAPGNFGPEFRDAFAAMYPELAEAHGATLYPDLLAPMSARAARGERFAELMQDDQIHPNARGVAVIVEELGPAVVEFLDSLGAEDGA